MDPNKVPLVKLNNGLSMPIIGLGTWQSPPDGSLYKAIMDAIDAGYRHIDGAYAYGNEEEVGKAVNDAIKSGKVKREELFVVTKLWMCFFKRDRVRICVKRSLDRLGLDYLDLVLIHWPMAFDQVDDEVLPKDKDGNVRLGDVDYLEAWQGLEDLVNEGLIKSIGVSNFNHSQVERLLANCRIKPVTNQVECNPYLAQRKLIDWSKERNVVVTGYSPLGNPGSTFIPTPTQADLINDPKVKAIADKHGKSVGQVLIRFQVQRGVVVIPKSVRKERIVENIRVFDFELSEDEIKHLEAMDCGRRYMFDLGGIPRHPNHPFKGDFGF